MTRPAITNFQTAQQMVAAAKDTQDPRMKALAAASTALSAHNAYDALQAGQGKTVAIKNPDGGTTVKDNQIAVLNDKGEATGYRDAKAADKVGGIGINLSIGSSKSRSQSTQTSDSAAVSRLAAGNDITLTAQGGGAASDILLQGAQVSAGNNATLHAEDELRLLAAQNISAQHSTNKNSSASLGAGFMLGGTQNGFTLQAGISGGKGKADGHDLTHDNTHLTAGDTVTLKSGGDTTLQGAVVKGEKVVADIGGNLQLESLQDTSTYDSDPS